MLQDISQNVQLGRVLGVSIQPTPYLIGNSALIPHDIPWVPIKILYYKETVQCLLRWSALVLKVNGFTGVIPAQPSSPMYVIYIYTHR